MIELVAGHADRGTLVVGQEDGIPGAEQTLRFFASENRFSRRQLGRALLEVRRLASHGIENQRVRTVYSPRAPDRAYIFCVLRRDDMDEASYRRDRQAMLVARAEIAKLRMETLRLAMALGFAPENERDESIDLAVREFPEPWPQESRERVERLCGELGIPRDRSLLRQRHTHDTEFSCANT
jgi:hypothetical protein